MRALLTHAWLFLGKWLGRLLLLLLAVGLGGWAIGSLYYAWKFSGPVSAEEQIAPDEARITQAIIQTPSAWSNSTATTPASCAMPTPRPTAA